VVGTLDVDQQPLCTDTYLTHVQTEATAKHTAPTLHTARLHDLNHAKQLLPLNIFIELAFPQDTTSHLGRTKRSSQSPLFSSLANMTAKSRGDGGKKVAAWKERKVQVPLWEIWIPIPHPIFYAPCGKIIKRQPMRIGLFLTGRTSLAKSESIKPPMQ